MKMKIAHQLRAGDSGFPPDVMKMLSRFPGTWPEARRRTRRFRRSGGVV
jgi:hypothetical protein